MTDKTKRPETDDPQSPEEANASFAFGFMQTMVEPAVDGFITRHDVDPKATYEALLFLSIKNLLIADPDMSNKDLTALVRTMANTARAALDEVQHEFMRAADEASKEESDEDEGPVMTALHCVEGPETVQ